MRRVIAAVLVLAAAAVTPPHSRMRAQEQLSTGNAAISGVVRDARTGRPVHDALVSLNRTGAGLAPGGPAAQLSDDKGRFIFPNLAAGHGYMIRVTRMGFLEGTFGGIPHRRETAAAIDLADGQWVANADVTLWRPGAVSGTVTDDHGDPLVGAFVRVLSVVRAGGREHLATGPIAVADDRGMYRVGGLVPGRYVAMVPQSMYPLAFSAPLDDIGRAPELEFGAELRGVDVRVNVSSAFSISGVVQGPPGAVVVRPLRLLGTGLGALGAEAEVAVAIAGPDGAFTFTNVPGGAYTIDAPASLSDLAAVGIRLFYGPQPRTSSTNVATTGITAPGLAGRTTNAGALRGPDFWARTPVAVSGADTTGVVVSLQPTAALTVKIDAEIDPGQPRRAEDRPSVYLDPAAGDPTLGRPRSDPSRTVGTPQQIGGISPGRYVFRTGSLGWMIKSVVANGCDVTHSVFDASTDLPFSSVDVTLTDAVPTLAGTVRTSGNTPVVAAVIAFPVERDQWIDYGQSPARIAAVVSSASGAYRLTRLAAGDYYVVALPAQRFDMWRDPDFLARAVPMATRVSIGWGESRTQDLRVIDVR